MSTPTHFATGVLVAHFLFNNGFISTDQNTSLTLWSGIMANLPDIDGLNPKKIKNHRRNSVFHFPLIWLLAFVFWTFWIYLTGNSHYVPYFWIAAINILLHFILDSLSSNSGIQWLAPFSLKEYSFIRAHYFCVYNLPRFIKYYLIQPLMIIEVIIIMAGAAIFSRPYTGWFKPVEAKTTVVRKNVLKTWLENRKALKSTLLPVQD